MTGKAPDRADVIVIGAGAAGLSCARTLIDAGRSVIVCEARGRLGGRILTEQFPELDLPIELGAEFVHGAAEETLKRAAEAGLVTCDAYEGHLYSQAHRKADRRVDYWARMEKLFDQLDPKRPKDRSVAEFFQAHKKSTDPLTLSLAAAFVEGFHSAELTLIGERALALAEQSDGGPSIAEAQRLTLGYQSLINSYVHGISGATKVVRLSTVVKKIVWKKGEAHLTCLSAAGFPLAALTANKIVITIPLGVLKAPPGAEAAIAFEPQPVSLANALTRLHMGHAMRIAFRFHGRFWEELAPPEVEKKVGYLHAGPDTDFPTWWTAMPIRAPVLTAWQGGPRAARLSELPESARVQSALDTLARLLGCKRARIEQELVSWKTHDWTHDPFSLGAYSYVGVDGTAAARQLTVPIASTLYFAGEATSLGTARGTVEGAIASGLRAAKQILKV